MQGPSIRQVPLVTADQQILFAQMAHLSLGVTLTSCFESPQDRTTVLKNYSLAFYVYFVYFVVSLRHRIVRRMLSMGTSIAARKPLLVLGLFFFFSLGRFPATAQDQKPMDSGIELIGRSDKEPPPQVWHVEDAKTKKKVASVDSR